MNINSTIPLIRRLCEFHRKSGMKLTRIAELTGLPYQTITTFIYDKTYLNKRLTLRTRATQALTVFFEKYGFLAELDGKEYGHKEVEK